MIRLLNVSNLTANKRPSLYRNKSYQGSVNPGNNNP